MICRGGKGGRELWTRKACTDELGVGFDDADIVVKGDDGNAGLGGACCTDREEEFTGRKGGTCRDGRMEMMYVV